MLVEVPALGAAIPRRGSSRTRALGRLALTLLRWRVAGALPDLGKFVIVVEPHTSNWDFVVGIATLMALGFRGSFLGKHTLFRGPLGAWLRHMGGIPVDRTQTHGVVEQVVGLFQSSHDLILALAPSGTRRVDAPWKLGFYHIARGANVPVVPVSFDYPSRTLTLGPPVALTGDVEGDVSVLKAFYASARGKRGSTLTPAP